jgi:hypothetical protein
MKLIQNIRRGKKHLLPALFIAGLAGLTSCNDYLDMTPTTSASDKLVWSKAEYAELAVNSFYHLTHYYSGFNTWQCTAGLTEALTDIFKYGSTTYNAHMYIPSEIAYGGSVLTANFVSVYLGNWSNDYTYARRINEGLSNMKKYSSFDAETTAQLEAEMRFFRAMVYFDLVKRYKEVIIYDEDLTQITQDKAVSTEKEGWDFIEADLRFAAENLPVSNSAVGRITQGAAWAFLSRVMLYAERWDVAKEAAEKVMAMNYSLTANYADAFKLNSTEAILQYVYDKSAVSHSFDNYYAPGGDKSIYGNAMTGGYGTPTQEFVESFELADGSGFPDWTPWHTTEGTRETPPYDKLEPRFQASVLYNGSSWKTRTIEPYIDGADGWCTWKVDPTPDGRTTTGYYLRKLVDETHDFATLNKSTQPWTELRLAEVLLNYAEACYRTNDIDNANSAVRKIRERVGLPWSNKSGDELWNAIRQERKVELAFEGHYYWDMRRWKLADTAFTGYRVHGLKIEKLGESFKYTYVECDTEDRNFPTKMYRFPMPEDELSNNAAVNQYAEWQ